MLSNWGSLVIQAEIFTSEKQFIVFPKQRGLYGLIYGCHVNKESISGMVHTKFCFV